MLFVNALIFLLRNCIAPVILILLLILIINTFLKVLFRSVSRRFVESKSQNMIVNILKMFLRLTYIVTLKKNGARARAHTHTNTHTHNLSLSVCLSAYLSVYLSIYLSIYSNKIFKMNQSQLSDATKIWRNQSVVTKLSSWMWKT